MVDWWLEVFLIHKVLRLTKQAKVFLARRTNAELVSKFHVALLFCVLYEHSYP